MTLPTRWIIAATIPALLGVAWMLASVYLFSSYGTLLFVGAPLGMGVLAANLCELLQLRSKLSLLLLSSISLAGCALLLIAGHLEGLICVLMALPLALPLALFGGLATRALVRKRSRTTASAACLLALPLLPLLPLNSQLRAVTSQVEIAAPPEVVWHNVVSFPDLPPPSELLFRAGLAYPERARIIGHGVAAQAAGRVPETGEQPHASNKPSGESVVRGYSVGAVRYCEFSTGAFEEPISIWREPQLLAFSVSHSPEPMRELTPYHDLHPPHLNGYFASRRGQFLLTPLSGNRTRLEGTTWYELKLGPGWYWRLWCDVIIHQIHERVLQHIKALAEAEMQKRPA